MVRFAGRINIRQITIMQREAFHAQQSVKLVPFNPPVLLHLLRLARHDGVILKEKQKTK